MGYEERDALYQSIYEKLILPFPSGTVDKKNASDKSAYIPVQAYMNRVTTAAGNYASWTLTSPQAVIYEAEGVIEMRGLLKIVDAQNEGVGHATFIRNQHKKIENFGEVVKRAASAAYVDACNKFQIGWIDLPRKFTDNPGTGVPQRKNGEGKLVGGRKCIKPNCDNWVNEEYLQFVSWNNQQCPEHVPEHIKKKYQDRLNQ